MGPLYYLAKPHDEVLQDYFGLFGSHIAPEWRSEERLLAILQNEKEIAVFVPQKWEGISGLEPIELEFAEDMPTSHKPKARLMNPKT